MVAAKGRVVRTVDNACEAGRCHQGRGARLRGLVSNHGSSSAAGTRDFGMFLADAAFRRCGRCSRYWSAGTWRRQRKTRELRDRSGHRRGDEATRSRTLVSARGDTARAMIFGLVLGVAYSRC